MKKVALIYNICTLRGVIVHSQGYKSVLKCVNTFLNVHLYWFKGF